MTLYFTHPKFSIFTFLLVHKHNLFYIKFLTLASIFYVLVSISHLQFSKTKVSANIDEKESISPKHFLFGQ